MTKSFIVAMLLCAIAATATAEEREWEIDDGTVFELGLGNTQVFDPRGIPAELTQVVPTESVLLQFEYYLHYRWHLSAIFNWPTRTSTTLVDGVLVQRYVAPFLGVGVVWIPLTIPFSEKRHRVELHAGVFGGAALRNKPLPNGLFALRAYVLHESGFGVYVGPASSFIIDTAALIYGIGYRF